MGYPKFNFTEEQKEKFIAIILEVAAIVEIPGKLKFVEEDPDDDVILETAIIGKTDYLVSGDSHLLKLKEFSKVRIVTASEFLGV